MRISHQLTIIHNFESALRNMYFISHNTTGAFVVGVEDFHREAEKRSNDGAVAWACDTTVNGAVEMHVCEWLFQLVVRVYDSMFLRCCFATILFFSRRQRHFFIEVTAIR